MTSTSPALDVDDDFEDLPPGGFDPRTLDQPAPRPGPIKVTLRSFLHPSQADDVFRQAMANGDYPVIPDAVRSASTAKGRIRALSQAVGAITIESTNAIVDRTVAQLAAGEPVDPAVYLQDLEAAHLRETVALTQQNIDRAMIHSLDLRWRQTLREAQPEMLAGLGEQLAELMDQLQEADALIGDLDVTDPIAVARADDDQRRGLNAMSDLVSVYPRIRIAQQALMAAAGEKNPARDVDDDAWTVEQDKKTWADVFGSGVHAFRDVPMAGYTTAGLEGLQLMRVLARRDDAWMPTYEEITEAWAELKLGEPEIRARRAARLTA